MKKRRVLKKWMIICAAVLLVLSLQQMLPGNPGDLSRVKAAGISLNSKKITLIKGQSTTVRVKGTSKKAKWSSSNRAVASVKSNGRVTARKKGSAVISARIKNKSYKCTVNVESPYLNKRTCTLKEGQSIQLKLLGTRQKVTWSSSSKSVAAVTRSGRVSGRKKGSARITASVRGKYFSCVVTVNTKPIPPKKDDTLAGAGTIASGSVVKGAITQTADFHYYRINLASAGKLNIKFASYMKSYGIKIINSAGEELWSSSNNQWNESVGYRKDEHNVYLEKGTYYIQANGFYYNSKTTGNYELAVFFLPSGVTNREPDNSFAQANTFTVEKGRIVGQISQGDDWDTFKFVLNSSGRVALSATSYMRYCCIQLFDSAGKEIWNSDNKEYNSNVGYRRDDYDLDLEKGIYYLQIRGGYSWNKAYGKYEISTSFTNAGATNKEPDNSFQTPNIITLGAINRGIIALGDDRDIYKLNLSASKNLNLSVTSYLRYYCVMIFDSNGKEVWKSYDKEWNENVGYRSDQYEISLDRGMYYLQLDGTWRTARGNYQFILQ